MKYTNHHVSDLVVRINNSAKRNHSNVSVPNIRVVRNVLEVLLEEGYIVSFKEDGRSIDVVLKYNDGVSVINSFKVLSRPSKRYYSKAGSIPSYFNGLGVVIVSTSKGVLSDRKAIEAGVGGEVLCQVF